MARKLAHIEQIHDIRPIAGADRIEQVKVLGWNLIAKKGEFQENDLCVYIEIDSKVPETDARYEFLANKGYKIKTMKMRGVISQGIALPLNMYPEIKNPKIGDDVTDVLKITKIITAEEKRLMREENAEAGKQEARLKQRYSNFYKSKVGKWLMAHKYSRLFLLRVLGGKKVKPQQFPSWIRKTDEERIQNLPQYCELTNKFYATEKVDGTSSTFAVDAKNKKCTKFEFIVCSRNVRQNTPDQKNFFEIDNVYWEMAKKYDIQNVLEKIAKEHKWAKVVLQGETVGAGLQGNRYNYDDRKFFGYNFIVNGTRWDSVKARDFLADYGIPWVPILDTEFTMLPTVDDMLAYAEGYSVIVEEKNKLPREGIVFRAVDDPELSFKAVSNSFLMEKHPDLLARDKALKLEEELRGKNLTREERIAFFKENNLFVK